MDVRTFQAGDEAVLAEIWNRGVKGCYATGPLTAEQWKADVAAKTYFEPEGVFLAFEGGKPRAFVHAGFKSADGVVPDHRLGTITMVAAPDGRLDAGQACMADAIRYLFRRGAKQVEAFTIDFANTPFYNGLYGGEKAGMDELHPSGLDLMKACHFNFSSGGLIMICELKTSIAPWRPTDGLTLRVEEWTVLWQNKPWAESYGIPEQVRRASVLDADGKEKGGIAFWHLDRYNRATGDRLGVVTHVGVSPDVRGSGVAQALQLEVHRILQTEGATRVGLGVAGGNGRAVAFYTKLDYRPFRAAYFFHLDWRHYGDFR